MGLVTGVYHGIQTKASTASSSADKLHWSPNQVAVEIEIVGLMRGEEVGKMGDICAIDITAVVFLEVHVSYPTALAEHEKQHTGRDDRPSYAYARQTCALLPDSGSRCHTGAYHAPLPKRHRRHEHLWHSVHARNRHAPQRVCHDLGAGEDIYELFVWREDSIDLPYDWPRTLAPYIGKERQHRGLEDRHGMFLNREHLHLRRK